MNEQNGLNIKFAIYYDDANNQRQSFHGIVLHKTSYDNVIMSLGRNITGEFVWIDNKLQFTMKEYVIFNDVKYYIVNPPTVTHNGLVRDNSSEKGSAKYAVTFYHPEYTLGAIPFNDVAVTDDEQRYLSQNKVFSWIGNLTDYVNKLNANLVETEWVCRIDGSVPTAKLNKLSDVLSFDKNFISDALKTAYETYDVPFITSVLSPTDEDYSSGKRYLIKFGLPSEEIIKEDIETLHCDETSPIANVYYYREPIYVFTGDEMIVSPHTQGYEGVILDKNLNYIATHNWTATENTEIYVGVGGGIDDVTFHKNGAYVFRFGKNLGLKNNSATPKNNKIVTRIYGHGSERNIPYGYPQIPWTGDQSWTDTKNDPTDPTSYPIYSGIYGGQWIKLIKHPFTRTNLMPSIYSETVNRKVNPMDGDYNPNIEIKDYYDAPGTYPNPINPNLPCCEIHEFEDIYPRLWGDGEKQIVGVNPYDTTINSKTTMLLSDFDDFILSLLTEELRLKNPKEYDWLLNLKDAIDSGVEVRTIDLGGTNPTETMAVFINGNQTLMDITHTSPDVNFHVIVSLTVSPEVDWDDSMDDDGNYKQSYFQITLPPLGFDMYACANITEQMDINMRSGACLGCTFTIQCDWDDYKSVFYDDDGNFVPNGEKRQQRIADYPNSTNESITVIVAKDLDTFGIIKPNIYQKPQAGDSFVILGISLPQTYIHNAELELDDAMKEYMLENNVYYFDYPLNFDEKFLRDNLGVLLQLDNNKVVRFMYGNNILALYIKQLNIKFGDGALPQYSITLTDDVEIVLNQLGQTTEDVSNLRIQVSQIAQYYGMTSESGYATLQKQLDDKLSKISNDIANGHITFQQGLTALEKVYFNGVVQSRNFAKGLDSGVGKGWQIDDLGNAEMESLRIRSFLEVVELLINRVQAQEGDTMFTDNDQIEMVEEVIIDGDDSVYRLSLKEKWDGYITSQQGGNILKGVINTLAANQGGVSNVDGDDSGQSSDTGGNKYYTSWMYVLTSDEVDALEQEYEIPPLPALEINQIYVRCYKGSQTPSGTNFVPCEFMVITRWGCRDNSTCGTRTNTCSVPIVTNDASLIATISRRQQMFYLSTSEGRIVKLVGVNNPILRNNNYGTTLGILPDFVKQYTPVQQRILANPDYDYLYAQGVVVEDFIKIDYQGQPVINIVDKGIWTNTKTYLFESWDSQDLQYETHEVWYNGEKWRALATNTNSVPSDSNTNWFKVLTKGADGTSISIIDSVYAVAHDTSELSRIIPPTTYVAGIIIGNPYIYRYIGQYGWQIDTAKTVVEGSGVIYETNGHLWMWNGNAWTDCGQIKGDKGDDGADGVNGYNTAIVTLYRRSQTTLVDSDKPQQSVVYNFSNKRLETVPTNWSETIPSGNNPLYVTQATAYSNTNTDTIDPNDWSGIVKLVQDGADGNNGLNSATILLYKRSASNPTSSMPTGTMTYTFATGVLSGGNLNGWQRDVPTSDGNPCWIIQATAIGNGTTDTIGSNEWSTPNKFAQDGEEGANGYNTAIVYLYQRSSTALTDSDRPSNTQTYNFEQKQITTTPDKNWSKTIPSGSSPLYVIAATAYGNGATDTIASNEWSTPTIMAQNGANGNNGLNSATVFLYIRGATQPTTKPTGTFNYNFSTGALTPQTGASLNGWSQQIPSSNDMPCWVIQATASNVGNVDAISQNEWSSVSELVRDGSDGNGIASIYNYYALSTQGTTINDTTPPTIVGTWDTQQPTPTAQYPYVWQKTTTNYTHSQSVTRYILVAVRGNDGTGEQGKMGRNIYFAGEWIEKTPADTFDVTDFQAPYFIYENNKWVWVGDNGTYNINSTNRPSMQNSNWELMVSDFKYLISQAIFTEFARLGEWLFNGDYMFSNDGKDSNGNTTSYDDGGRYYGDGNSGNTYIPNLVMNAQSGKMWAKNIILQGVINNMIQEINTLNDFDNIGYYYNNIYYCNPLDVGTYIRCNLDQNRVRVMLPRAYTTKNPTEQGQAGSWTIDGIKENGQQFTLDEIRQCVGKKIIFMPGSCTWEFVSEQNGLPLFLRSEHFKLLGTDYNDDLHEIQNAWGETFNVETSLVAESNIGGMITANLTYVAECKVGNYKSCECIYWEITRSVKTLYQTY